MSSEYINSENGFTIIESLVTILIIGLILTMTIIVFNNLFSAPGLLLKSDAFSAATEEISKCVENRTSTDTIYNVSNNLVLKRKISSVDELLMANVSIIQKHNDNNIITLHVSYKKKQ